MPAARMRVKPGTRTGAVTEWLTKNPGWHTPTAIARGIGYTTQTTAGTLLYMAQHGQVERKRGGVNNGPGSSEYRIASPVTPE